MPTRTLLAVMLVALVAATLAASSSGKQPPGGTPPGFEQAVEAKENHAAKLLDKPGVAGVGVGINRGGRPVIEVYKEKDDVADLPDSLEGVPVESITTGIIEARAPTDRFPRPVPIGVSSGLDGVATGTLGARVTDGTNTYALSNNHVFAGINTASIGDPIIQPGNADGGSDPADRIGTLHAYQSINFNAGSTNTMDAAIALTSTANVGSATPPDGYGAPSPITTPALVGQGVQKYGRTTGLQAGTVAATSVTVDVCYLLLFDFCLQEARFVDQISVSPGSFSASGDSGSLIVTQGGNQPVALLFAGGDGLTIGTPIDTVLQRFGVTIEGTPPPDGPPGAPTSLGALAGDASVALSWAAPTFDGGSPVTNYKVYRGTTSGSETFLADAGSTTSYVDTSPANATTYYYKVSAVNANGEGALSNEASATPTDLVTPLLPLTVLDTFDRANESPLSDGGKWGNGVNGSGEAGLNVASNTLACSRTTTCTGWRSNAQYGPDVEVSTRISTLPGAGNQIRLYARLQQAGTSGYDGYMLRTNELAGTDEVYLERVDNGTIVRRLTLSQELSVGDVLLLRVKGPTLEAWRHDGAAWSRLGLVNDATYAGAGYVGVGLRGTAGRLDDFGARSLSQAPPGAPTGLAAVAGDASVSLSWSAPSLDGGSPVTSYRVYRGTSAGSEAFLASASAATSYVDTGASNGTTYYYKVSAVNANGEGPLSTGASATPAAFVPPVEPLIALDSFDRANENPLSDSGKWVNGVNGSVETGLFVTSNVVACSKTSTCTAWRQNAQFGPDAEAWARLSTPPGDNNQLRLYVRLREAGTATYDGYMLRTNQLPGTDEVYLERVDNGTIVRLSTASQELAAGDVLLLRAVGSSLEAWRKSGSAWSRLATTADSTYAAACYTGLGLRGTTGRLDDFGARDFGVAPPPPVPPSVPASLAAQGLNGLVRLAWQPPASDGGSPVTGYRIYRGETPGGKTLLASVGAFTSYDDTAVVNGTTYYYEVSAENLVGEGPHSAEASATPTDVVLPVEPLPVLDDFNRANERPLSSVRWGDGVIGAGERSLKIASNQLASDRSTTATAWWKSPQFGPDSESWATIRTLPGNGNSFRLYVRLQSPGSSAADGYFLMFTQQSGADSIAIYRMTNGALTSLSSAAREITVGSRLLLRAQGTALEAWVHEAGTWTRILRLTDSTYATAGYVGVGIRGKTGRLDDFGGR
jgi:fibronectin type 3 domain-containing protein